jgi:sulfoxide reductase catalytic subunit YedY
MSKTWSQKLKIRQFKDFEVTPENLFKNRRALLKSAVALGLLPSRSYGHVADIEGYRPWDQESPGILNSYEDITNYNNFYEFGLDKADPARYSHTLETHPWQVEISGLTNKPGVYDLEEIIQSMQLEERIYKLRCVEAWSMIVPWIGFPLGSFLNQFEPHTNATFVQFFTLYDTDMMPGQRSRVLDWPYREGLTMEEAMHPLSFLATGLYGKTLPNQNGAPIRLVVPWKYGFKSIKSIVKIVFTDQKPLTSWNQANAREYGFYSNVNPNVSHPRWSQAYERVLGQGFFTPRVPTEMFNGYGEQVAHLYDGLDLQINY